MMRRNAVLMALLAACAAPLGLAAPFEATAADGTTATAGTSATSVAASGLSAAEVQRRMEDAGYANVRDVEYDDGRWEADATTAAGARVDLTLDRDGTVVLDPED